MAPEMVEKSSLAAAVASPSTSHDWDRSWIPLEERILATPEDSDDGDEADVRDALLSNDEHAPRRRLSATTMYLDLTRNQALLAAGLGALSLILCSLILYLDSPFTSKVVHPVEYVQATSGVDVWRPKSGSNEGVVLFCPDSFDPLLRARPLETTLSVKSFADSACLDDWVARGVVCDRMKGWFAKPANRPKFDVFWTWTNGTAEESMTAWRIAVSAQPSTTILAAIVQAATKLTSRAVERLLIRRKTVSSANIARHFRDHDELRYSVRSILSSFAESSLATLHLIVGDSPNLTPEQYLVNGTFSTTRAAQVPHWLNLDKISFGDAKPSTRLQGPALRVHPHSEIFKTSIFEASENNGTETEKARFWREETVPSFNSLAVESQLANVETTSDSVLAMNDDFFILRSLSSSDLFSPFTGPVFRMQADQHVGGVAPGKKVTSDPDGEWRGLGYANFLLNQRFGVRDRAYLVHQGKSISVPLLREAQQVFLQNLTETARARFRGKDHDELQPAFLFEHYVIEKHREALLWSFVVARSDSNHDGWFTLEERKQMAAELGFVEGQTTPIRVTAPSRSTLNERLAAYDVVSLERPKETQFEFSSADGYATFVSDRDMRRWRQWPSYRQKLPQSKRKRLTPANQAEQAARDAAVDNSGTICSLDVDFCLGEGFATSQANFSVADVFRRFAFERPRCGDCAIIELVRRSGERGLEAFLPPSDGTKDSSSPTAPPQVVGMAMTFEHAPFDFRRTNLSPRQQAVRLIQRYSYTVGDSPGALTRFVGVSNNNILYRAFSAMDSFLPAFLALNDDLGNFSSANLVKLVDDLFHKWFTKHLPQKSAWEL